MTLAALAGAKKLPVAELHGYGLSDSSRRGAPAVRMIYHDGSGAEIGVRYRRSLATEPRFEWRRGDHVALYGQTDLAKARRLGYVFIVEGESDCWTLWHYGLPAVGAPGKSTWKKEWAALLVGGEEPSQLYSWISVLVFGGEALPKGYSLETASLLLHEAWAAIEGVDDEGVLYNRIAQPFPIGKNSGRMRTPPAA